MPCGPIAQAVHGGLKVNTFDAVTKPKVAEVVVATAHTSVGLTGSEYGMHNAPIWPNVRTPPPTDPEMPGPNRIVMPVVAMVVLGNAAMGTVRITSTTARVINPHIIWYEVQKIKPRARGTD